MLRAGLCISISPSTPVVFSQKYLLEVKSIFDSYYLSGFHDYTHYLKSFKKKCGLTPKEYRKTWAALPQRF